MVTSRYRKREHRALGCHVCRRRDGVAMQLSMLRNVAQEVMSMIGGLADCIDVSLVV